MSLPQNNSHVLLHRFTLNNYKSFRKDITKIDFAIPNHENEGSGLTVFVGPNNSGKSNILESLNKACTKTQINFTLNLDFFYPNYPVLDLRWFCHNNINQAKVGNILFGKKILHGITHPEYRGELAENCHNIFRDSTYYLPSYKLYIDRSIETTPCAWNDYCSSRNSQFIGKNFNDIFSVDNQFIHYLTQLTAADEKVNAGNIAQSREFNSLLFDFFPQIKDWYLEPPENTKISAGEASGYIIKIITENGVSIPLSNMGFGFIRLFYLFAFIANKTPNSIFILDEPETSLHPQIQKKLAQLLFEVSKTNQVIISTHSPYFINLNNVQHGQKIIRVYKDKDNNTSQVKHLDEAMYSKLKFLNDPQKFYLFDVAAKEIFFSEKVVFTEGQEDVGYYKRYLETHYPDYDFDLFGYGAGGASNIIHLLEFATQMGIEAGAIYDGDQVPEYNKAIKQFGNQCIIEKIPADDVRDKDDLNGEKLLKKITKNSQNTSLSQADIETFAEEIRNNKSGLFDTDGNLKKPKENPDANKEIDKQNQEIEDNNQEFELIIDRFIQWQVTPAQEHEENPLEPKAVGVS